MQFSLSLIAERLCEKGHRAFAMNDRGACFRKVRMLPMGNRADEPDTLYVCEHQPETWSMDVSCAFAFSRMPGHNWNSPCLVVETTSNPIALVNALSDVVDEFEDALAEIGELAWKQGGLSEIVEVLSSLVGNPAYIVDSSFKVMAITNDPDMEEMSVNWMNAAKRGYLSYDVVANLIRSNELHDIESSDRATIVNSEFFYVPFINYNLRQEGRVQGHLFVVQMYKVIMPSDLELVDAVASHVLHALQVDPTFQAHRGPLYEHFVIDWLEGSLHDPAYILHQLEALSFSASDLSVVVIVQLSVDSDFRREHLARLLEDRQGCRAVSHDGQVIALFQLKRHREKDDVLRKVRGICRSQQCRASVSDVQDSFLDTPCGYRQARETLRICEAMGIEDDVVCYGDVAAYQPYLNFSSVEELNAFCHPAVVTLRDYDRTHAVQLLPTLSAFLKNDRDVQATASELFVHRNTLAYRLKKILEMCPLDLDDFNTRHRLLESILVMENYAGIVSHLG